MAFQAFWVEVIGLRHVEVGYNIFVCFIFEHISIKQNIMKVLVIFLVLKMVDDR